MSAKEIAEALLKLPLTSRLVTVALFLALSAAVGLHFSPYAPWSEIPWYGSGGAFVAWATAAIVCARWLVLGIFKGVRRSWRSVRHCLVLPFCDEIEKEILRQKARNPIGSFELPASGGADPDPSLDDLRIAVERLVNRGFMCWVWMSAGDRALLTESGRRAGIRLITKERGESKQPQ